LKEIDKELTFMEDLNTIINNSVAVNFSFNSFMSTVGFNSKSETVKEEKKESTKEEQEEKQEEQRKIKITANIGCRILFR
jgi:hypothetical protein